TSSSVVFKAWRPRLFVLTTQHLYFFHPHPEDSKPSRTTDASYHNRLAAGYIRLDPRTIVVPDPTSGFGATLQRRLIFQIIASGQAFDDSMPLQSRRSSAAFPATAVDDLLSDPSSSADADADEDIRSWFIMADEPAMKREWVRQLVQTTAGSRQQQHFMMLRTRTPTDGGAAAASGRTPTPRAGSVADVAADPRVFDAETPQPISPTSSAFFSSLPRRAASSAQ
ncbi:hypothetical protein HK405_002400, partial [Cladochytrium tenue]